MNFSMKTTFVEFEKYVKYLENAELEQFQEKTSINIVVARLEAAGIAGVHVFAPERFRDTLLDGEWVGLGRTYQAWKDAHLNSKEAAVNTQQALRQLGLSLQKFGCEALGATYVHGPREFLQTKSNIFPKSFLAPLVGLPAILAQMEQSSESIQRWVVPSGAGDAFGRNEFTDQVSCAFEQNGRLNAVFGVDEIIIGDANFLEAGEIRTNGVPLPGFSAAMASAEIKRAIQSVRELRGMDVARARQIVSAANVSYSVAAPALLPEFCDDLLQLVSERIRLVQHLNMPHFYKSFFVRLVSLNAEASCQLDLLRWALRQYPDDLQKTLAELFSYRNEMQNTYPWMFEDVLDGLVNVPTLTCFADSRQVRKLLHLMPSFDRKVI
jgi:hypothetical protein